MIDECRAQALAQWYRLLNEPSIRMDAQDQYDELLKAADEMERTGLISDVEWRGLVREAGVGFCNAVEGLGDGT